jgi:glucosamine 6-phosphate synthetase-like amidotransferase/phosphosugar isomerase protein
LLTSDDAPAPEDDTSPRSIKVMFDEIETIPAVIADQDSNLRPKMRDLAHRSAAEVQEIVLTGCGDSHFAGVATRLAFERAAGIRCRASEALELARYEMRYVPAAPPPLVVALSYSGEVGRTIEAAAAAAERGWSVVALTGRADGRLANTAGASVLMDVPTLGFSPGTSTFVAMVTALLILASELARARGRLEAAHEVDRALAEAPRLAAATLRASENPAREAAALIAESDVTTFLGAGPSRAIADFGAAKLFEGPQRYGVAQDLEEWAHEQYFVSGPRTPVVVVAPDGASRDRAGELLAEMSFIGVPAVLVSDRIDDTVAVTSRTVLPVAPGLPEFASPLLTCLPLALVGYFVAETLGTRAYGFPSAEHEAEHYQTIHRDTRGTPA